MLAVVRQEVVVAGLVVHAVAGDEDHGHIGRADAVAQHIEFAQHRRAGGLFVGQRAHDDALVQAAFLRLHGGGEVARVLGRQAQVVVAARVLGHAHGQHIEVAAGAGRRAQRGGGRGRQFAFDDEGQRFRQPVAVAGDDLHLRARFCHQSGGQLDQALRAPVHRLGHHEFQGLHRAAVDPQLDVHLASRGGRQQRKRQRHIGARGLDARCGHGLQRGREFDRLERLQRLARLLARQALLGLARGGAGGVFTRGGFACGGGAGQFQPGCLALGFQGRFALRGLALRGGLGLGLGLRDQARGFALGGLALGQITRGLFTRRGLARELVTLLREPGLFGLVGGFAQRGLALGGGAGQRELARGFTFSFFSFGQGRCGGGHAARFGHARFFGARCAVTRRLLGCRPGLGLAQRFSARDAGGLGLGGLLGRLALRGAFGFKQGRAGGIGQGHAGGLGARGAVA